MTSMKRLVTLLIPFNRPLMARHGPSKARVMPILIRDPQ